MQCCFFAFLLQCFLAARTSVCDLWFAMVHGLDVEGLAIQWEANSVLRSRMRDSGSLFLDKVDGRNLEVNAKCTVAHSDVLLPLLERLVGADGSIGMCSIPALEVQYLIVYYYFFLPRGRYGIEVCDM